MLSACGHAELPNDLAAVLADMFVLLCVAAL